MAAVSKLNHQDDSPVFPDEIFTEILSRLPVKSLVRFRCVCKDWNSLFSNPAFIKLHFQRSPKNTQTLCIFSQPRGGIDVETYAICSKPRLFESPASAIEECNTSYSHMHQLDVLGACNGLACLIDYQVLSEQSWSDRSRHWFVYLNPATRIQSQSPSLILSEDDYYFMGIKANLRYGFCYDDSIDTYKVVVMLMDRQVQHWEFKVHCLGDAGWAHALTCPLFPIVGDGRGVFASGNICWLALKTPGPVDDWERSVESVMILCYDGWETLVAAYEEWEIDIINDLEIFSYDIKDNTYKHFSMPGDLSNVCIREPRLGVLKGCLSLSIDDGNSLDVWIREIGNEESWIKLLNLKYDDSQIGAEWPITPLCMSEDEEFLLLMNNEIDGFIVYNRGQNRIEYTEDITKNRFGFMSYDYVESLELPIRH